MKSKMKKMSFLSRTQYNSGKYRAYCYNTIKKIMRGKNKTFTIE